MRTARYISINERILFSTVIREKNAPKNLTLTAIEARVRVAYNVYINNFTALQTQTRSIILNNERAEKQALNHCFDSPTQSFKNIRGLIKSGQDDIFKIWCPYCLLNESDTLDHYIPKVKFSEYSILIKNLIPCCTQCNKVKDEEWCKKTQRRIIHYYIDTFLNNRFLFARITLNRKTKLPIINFYLQKPLGLTNYQFSIIKFHFKDLQLISRYNDRVNARISTHVGVIEAQINNGIDNVIVLQQVLQETYNSNANTFGVNYWEAIVYEAFSLNTRYLNSLL